MASTRSFRGVRIIRFGEFEFDLRAAELRKGELKIRLQEQPFRILVMLLEHPGEVVLREEIRKRLWPNGTIVEVGHGINAAVLRLCAAPEREMIVAEARHGPTMPIGIDAPGWSRRRIASGRRDAGSVGDSIRAIAGRAGAGCRYPECF